MSENMHTVTGLLQAFAQGDRSDVDTLLSIIYSELKQIASLRLQRESDEITLCTTDLVHEAYLKLCRQQNKTWENRAHFFACAAEAMRQILVEHARKQKAAKRGGNQVVVSIENAPVISTDNFEMILIVDDALEKLESMNQRQGKIVELRYFAGLTIEETAFAMVISETTVKRDWRFAKAWLMRELEGQLDGIR